MIFYCTQHIMKLSYPTFGINGSFGSPEKKFTTNFSKASTNFAWVCIIVCISYWFLNGQEVFNFKADNKADNKNVNFPTQFCLASISNGFSTIESREVYLGRNSTIFQLIIMLLISLTY